MTSSTKPEVGLHNVLNYRRRRTEPWPQETCIKCGALQFGRAVFEIRERTIRPIPTRGRVDRPCVVDATGTTKNLLKQPTLWSLIK